MPSHSSKVEFRDIWYIETVGFNPHGQEDGVITWGRDGFKSQMIGYYEPNNPESVENARNDIKAFLSDDRTKADLGEPGAR